MNKEFAIKEALKYFPKDKETFSRDAVIMMLSQLYDQAHKDGRGCQIRETEAEKYPDL
jgi:hypothetical protein